MSPGIKTQVFPQFPKTGCVGDFPGAWEPWDLPLLGCEDRSLRAPAGTKVLPTPGWGEGLLHPSISKFPPHSWGFCGPNPCLCPATVASGTAKERLVPATLVGLQKWPRQCLPPLGHTGPDGQQAPPSEGPGSQVGSPHLVRLPVSEEVDRAIQAPLDDGPAPGVVSLVAPHLHEAVGVLWLHQVDGAGVVAVLQGLQAVSPGAWGHRRAASQTSLLPGRRATSSPSPHPWLRPAQHGLGQDSSWKPQTCRVTGLIWVAQG